MRTLRLILVVALVSAGAGCDGATPPRRPDESRPSTVEIWTANLEHLLPEHDWTEFIARVTAGSGTPDLLFLSELTRSESERVVAALQEESGSTYAFEHAPLGNNAVVWEVDRFGDRPSGKPLLWQPFGTAGCRKPSEKDPSEVIGVRLLHEASEQAVVAVGVHWGRTWAARCMEKNMASLDERIEERWSERPLTVLAGDLNAHPDKQPVPGEPGAESLESGRETDPDCWYRALSALHDQTLAVSRPDEEDRDCANDPHYSPEADSYYDAVLLTHEGSGLCDQWTSVHGAPAPEGSSCTDTNDDGLRDRGRIDYIWLRWEDASGNATLPPPDASDLVTEAGADQVCIVEACAATRYSDHRAVFARVLLEGSN